jgi:hypothetical protein
MTSFYEKSFAIGVCEKKLSFLVAPPNVFFWSKWYSNFKSVIVIYIENHRQTSNFVEKCAFVQEL